MLKHLTIKDDMDFRIGHGFDVHRLAKGEELWLGGIMIPHEKGTVAHSDGDVLIHAICDALLGAVKAGDIGKHFPDSSEKYRDIDSKILLKEATKVVQKKGYEIVNLDSTLVIQKPRLRQYIPLMEKVLADVMEIDEDQVSIKATTTEELGYEGREEGISAHATVLVQKNQEYGK